MKNVDPQNLAGAPGDATIERRLLGALLRRPDELAAARAKISASTFSDDINAAIWRAFCDVVDKGLALVREIVARHVNADTDITMSVYLAKLQAECTSPEALDSYLHVLIDLQAQRESAPEAVDFPLHVDDPDENHAPRAAVPTAAFARIINPCAWEGMPVPPREWIVPGYIPHKTVTLLYADGATGKSLLSMQLGAARALGLDWVGLAPEPGRSLILSAEDDADEMHRRLDDIRKLYGANFSDLSDLRLIDLVGENSILGSLVKGQIEPTPMYRALNDYMAEFRPSLVVLDVLADMFAGDENDRPQARQFIGLLKKLARDHRSAFLLLAHPSITGMSSGSGMSGSTGWSNSVRSRLYFQTAKASDGSVADKNIRTLEAMKSNYGAIGEHIALKWEKGAFVPVAAATGLSKLAADAKADDMFMAMLQRLTEQGRNVSTSTGPTFAPTRFVEEPDAKGISKKQFTAAMTRLLKDKKICVQEYGPPSHRRSKIVLKLENSDPSNALPTPLPTPFQHPQTASNTPVFQHPPYPPGVLEGTQALEDAGAYQPPEGKGAGADVVEVEI